MKSSVFVRVDRFNELSEVISQIMGKLDDAKAALKKVRELKSQEDAELSAWQAELDSVEGKLGEISSAMNER